MGEKINHIIRKIKPKKEIEKAKPIEIKKPTTSELRDLVAKRAAYTKSINFYKQEIEKTVRALKKLENNPN